MTRIVSWNIRKARANSAAWPYLIALDPDLVMLQEVIELPEDIRARYNYMTKPATKQNGSAQPFSTAILAKGEINAVPPPISKYEWVNNTYQGFSGNILNCAIDIPELGTCNVVSFYSPAWPIIKGGTTSIDVSDVKLQQNPDVYLTEILWTLVREAFASTDRKWIIGGDFNSSETFDLWRLEGRGNRELMDRMIGLGLKECLRSYSGKLVPTFRHSKGGITHQIDHLYVSGSIYDRLLNCQVGDSTEVFGNRLSDHLPIIADIGFPSARGDSG